MANVLSMEAASRIWTAHREIEVGRKLLADIKEALKEGRDPNPVDHWGRRRHFSLGVPSGETSERIVQLSPKLAMAIIEAHIADKEKELKEASIAARIELESPLL
jgi:hypothetical protein